MLLLLVMACTPDEGPNPGPMDANTSSPVPLSPPGIVTFEGTPPTNVLLVSLDTLRRDRVGRYGGGANTPFLDALFDRSIVLDNHRSCSDWTAPSMTCALTGLFPPLHNFWPNTTSLEGVVSLPEIPWQP